MNSLLAQQKTSINGIELEHSIIQTLIKDLRTVLYVASPNGHLLFITPSVKELLGYDQSDFSDPVFCHSLVHPDEISTVLAFYRRINEVEDFKVTVRLRMATGEYLLVDNEGTVKKENGLAKYIIGTISEPQKKTQFTGSNENNYHYYEQLMDRLGLAFYSIDTNYRITSFNKIFAEWAEKGTGVSLALGDSIFFETAGAHTVHKYKTLFDRALKGEFLEDIGQMGDEKLQIAMTPVYVKDRIEGVAVLHLNQSKESKLLDTLLNLNKKVENIINSTDELIYAMDTSFRFISFNDAYKKHYEENYGVQPLIGELNLTSQHTDNFTYDPLRLYKRALQGEETETEFTSHNHIIYIITVKPLTDNMGRIFGLTVYYKNVSKIRESEKKLIQSEERFKYVVDHVTDVVFQTDAQGNWTYLNNAWKTIMDFEVADSVGTLFYNYLHPDDVEKNQQLFEPLILRKKEYCSHEIRYITKSGTIKWIRVFATLLLNEANEIIGTTGTLKDINKEKENSYRYELLAQNASDLICLHEMDGTYIYVSPSHQELTGYQNEEIVGKRTKDFIHPDDLAQLKQQDKEILENHITETTMNYRFKVKSGDYHWYESSVRVIFDEFYGRKLIISSSRNIDKRKQAEEQMLSALNTEKQLNELKSKFVSMASHEFRTPMTSIKAGAEIADLFLQRFEDEDILKAREFIKNIDHEIDRLTELISNILLLSKIESDSLRLHKMEIDLVTTLHNIISRQNNMQQDGRSVLFCIKGTPKSVYLDRLHLSHIIDNLLSNAFKYSPGCPSPELYLNYEPEGFEIIIKDFGIGIPDEEQEQVFRTFFRAKNTETISGTGIGLVLVQNFVTMHGGHIRFESEQNKGTTFFVNMPYSE